jgi:hypothetical protein
MNYPVFRMDNVRLDIFLSPRYCTADIEEELDVFFFAQLRPAQAPLPQIYGHNSCR